MLYWINSFWINVDCWLRSFLFFSSVREFAFFIPDETNKTIFRYNYIYLPVFSSVRVELVQLHFGHWKHSRNRAWYVHRILVGLGTFHVHILTGRCKTSNKRWTKSAISYWYSIIIFLTSKFEPLHLDLRRLQSV